MRKAPPIDNPLALGFFSDRFVGAVHNIYSSGTVAATDAEYLARALQHVEAARRGKRAMDAPEIRFDAQEDISAWRSVVTYEARLEPDSEWPGMRMEAMAWELASVLSTGQVTPECLKESAGYFQWLRQDTLRRSTPGESFMSASV